MVMEHKDLAFQSVSVHGENFEQLFSYDFAKIFERFDKMTQSPGCTPLYLGMPTLNITLLALIVRRFSCALNRNESLVKL
jgi:hypothetical protein